VGRILLVGGSCRIPYVRQLLEDRFHRPVVRVDEPELAVCLGAAIYQDVSTSKRAEAERRQQEAQDREQIKAEQERQQLEAMLQKERQQRIEAEQERQRVETEKKSGEKSFQFEVVLLDKRGNINNREQKESRYQWIYLGDGVSLDMVYIPGGSFMMGSPVGEKFLGLLRYDEDAGRDKERPQHLVTLPPFQMGKNPSHRQGADLPVENVSWLDAQDFCEKLSQKTGKKFRLPSEAEWEYACRAGTSTDFHFGVTITTNVANFGGYPFGGAPKSHGPRETTAVGSYRVANNFGLYDMHGNVEEWCLDEWTTDYQGVSINGRARGDVFSLDGNKKRIKRGGSYHSTAWSSRSAHRSIWTASDNCMSIGFRVLSPQDS
jgi:formylglycine-generating enzyme required for sulfatase activity